MSYLTVNVKSTSTALQKIRGHEAKLDEAEATTVMTHEAAAGASNHKAEARFLGLEAKARTRT